MTTKLRCLPPALLLLALAACEKGAPKIEPGPSSPHGGVLVPLPDGAGKVEILKRAEPGKKPQARVIVFFLDQDLKPASPSPTGVTLKALAAGPKPVDLKPETADPALSGGFISPPIPDRGEIDGELAATVDGKPITLPINAR